MRVNSVTTGSHMPGTRALQSVGQVCAKSTKPFKSSSVSRFWPFLNTLRYLLSFCSTSHCYTVCQECYSSWILGRRRAEGFFFLCEYRAGVWSPSRAPPTSRKYQIIKLELDSPIIALQGRDPQYRVQKCENICILKPYLDGNCFSRGCQWK